MHSSMQNLSGKEMMQPMRSIGQTYNLSQQAVCPVLSPTNNGYVIVGYRPLESTQCGTAQWPESVEWYGTSSATQAADHHGLLPSSKSSSARPNNIRNRHHYTPTSSDKNCKNVGLAESALTVHDTQHTRSPHGAWATGQTSNQTLASIPAYHHDEYPHMPPAGLPRTGHNTRGVNMQELLQVNTGHQLVNSGELDLCQRKPSHSNSESKQGQGSSSACHSEVVIIEDDDSCPEDEPLPCSIRNNSARKDHHRNDRNSRKQGSRTGYRLDEFTTCKVPSDPNARPVVHQENQANVSSRHSDSISRLKDCLPPVSGQKRRHEVELPDHSQTIQKSPRGEVDSQLAQSEHRHGNELHRPSTGKKRDSLEKKVVHSVLIEQEQSHQISESINHNEKALECLKISTRHSLAMKQKYETDATITITPAELMHLKLMKLQKHHLRIKQALDHYRVTGVVADCLKPKVYLTRVSCLSEIISNGPSLGNQNSVEHAKRNVGEQPVSRRTTSVPHELEHDEIHTVDKSTGCLSSGTDDPISVERKYSMVDKSPSTIPRLGRYGSRSVILNVKPSSLVRSVDELQNIVHKQLLDHDSDPGDASDSYSAIPSLHGSRSMVLKVKPSSLVKSAGELQNIVDEELLDCGSNSGGAGDSHTHQKSSAHLGCADECNSHMALNNAKSMELMIDKSVLCDAGFQKNSISPEVKVEDSDTPDHSKFVLHQSNTVEPYSCSTVPKGEHCEFEVKHAHTSKRNEHSKRDNDVFRETKNVTDSHSGLGKPLLLDSQSVPDKLGCTLKPNESSDKLLPDRHQVPWRPFEEPFKYTQKHGLNYLDIDVLNKCPSKFTNTGDVDWKPEGTEHVKGNHHDLAIDGKPLESAFWPRPVCLYKQNVDADGQSSEKKMSTVVPSIENEQLELVRDVRSQETENSVEVTKDVIPVMKQTMDVDYSQSYDSGGESDISPTSLENFSDIEESPSKGGDSDPKSFCSSSLGLVSHSNNSTVDVPDKKENISMHKMDCTAVDMQSAYGVINRQYVKVCVTPLEDMVAAILKETETSSRHHQTLPKTKRCHKLKETEISSKHCLALPKKNMHLKRARMIIRREKTEQFHMEKPDVKNDAAGEFRIDPAGKSEEKSDPAGEPRIGASAGNSVRQYDPAGEPEKYDPAGELEKKHEPHVGSDMYAAAGDLVRKPEPVVEPEEKHDPAVGPEAKSDLTAEPEERSDSVVEPEESDPSDESEEESDPASELDQESDQACEPEEINAADENVIDRVIEHSRRGRRLQRPISYKESDEIDFDVTYEDEEPVVTKPADPHDPSFILPQWMRKGKQGETALPILDNAIHIIEGGKRRKSAWKPEAVESVKKGNDPDYVAVDDCCQPGDCEVCGQTATHDVQGILSCERCKGVFLKGHQARLVCFADKACPIKQPNEKNCEHCLYQKCLQAGMEPYVCPVCQRPDRIWRHSWFTRVRLVCQYCRIGCKSEDERALHIKQEHNSRRIWTCRKCDMESTSRSSADMHRKMCKKTKNNICRPCVTFYMKYEDQGHHFKCVSNENCVISVHNTRGKTCTSCRYHRLASFDMKQHIRNKTWRPKNPGRAQKCMICHEVCFGKWSLKKHALSAHIITEVLKPKQRCKRNISRIAVRSKQRGKWCSICRKYLPRSINHAEHTSKHQKILFMRLDCKLCTKAIPIRGFQLKYAAHHELRKHLACCHHIRGGSASMRAALKEMTRGVQFRTLRKRRFKYTPKIRGKQCADGPYSLKAADITHGFHGSSRGAAEPEDLGEKRATSSAPSAKDLVQSEQVDQHLPSDKTDSVTAASVARISTILHPTSEPEVQTTAEGTSVLRNAAAVTNLQQGSLNEFSNVQSIVEQDSVFTADEWTFLCSFCGHLVESEESLRDHCSEFHMSEYNIDQSLYSSVMTDQNTPLDDVIQMLNSITSPDSQYPTPEVDVESGGDQGGASLMIGDMSHTGPRSTQVPEPSLHCINNDVDSNLAFTNDTIQKGSEIISDQAHDDGMDSDSTIIMDDTYLSKHKASKSTEPQKDLAIGRGRILCHICGVFVNFLGKHLYEDHKDSAGTILYRCSSCPDIRFSSLNRAWQHLRCRHSAENFLCEVCGRWFKSKMGWMRHIAETHERTYKYKCPACKFETTDRKEHNRHLRTAHSKDLLSRTCDICGKVLSCYITHQKHMNMHKNIKKHKCTRCPRSFIQKFTLELHELTHDGIKPFKCPACPQAYGQPYTLQQHIAKKHPGLEYKVKHSVRHVKK